MSQPKKKKKEIHQSYRSIRRPVHLQIMGMGTSFGLQTALNKQTRPMFGREKGIRLTKDTSWHSE